MSRVALFAPTLEGGGVQLFMLRLARGLRDRGYEIDLVLSEVKGERAGDAHPDCRIVDLRAGRPRVVTKTVGLARYLRRARPAALITAEDVVGASVWACAMSGAPTAVVIGVHTHLERQIGARTALGTRVRRAARAPQLPAGRPGVAVSGGVGENVAKVTGLDRARIPVVPNPAVPPHVAELARARPAHPWLQPGGPPVILGAGRMARQKDFPTLVRAFARVHAARPEARVIILGGHHPSEPGGREQLERLIDKLGLTEAVGLPGYVQNPYAWMAHATVFALSSVYKGFGLVLAEAMATGVALVSTDCLSGPREILDDGRLGTLVPVGDDAALGDALLAALADPGDPGERRRAAQRFTFAACADGYEAILREVVRA